MRLSRKAAANGALSTRLVFARSDGVVAKPHCLSGVLPFEGSPNRRRMHMLLSAFFRINIPHRPAPRDRKTSVRPAYIDSQGGTACFERGVKTTCGILRRRHPLGAVGITDRFPTAGWTPNMIRISC